MEGRSSEGTAEEEEEELEKGVVLESTVEGGTMEEKRSRSDMFRGFLGCAREVGWV